MSYESVKFIEISGRPRIPVPSSMTAEQVISRLGLNLANFDEHTEGDVLYLQNRSVGTKGALSIVDASRVQLVNGRVLPVPMEGLEFPTVEDVKRLATLFPEDDLFETLNDPNHLQRYTQAIGDALAQQLDNEQQSKLETDRALFDSFISAATTVRDNLESVNVDPFIDQIIMVTAVLEDAANTIN